MRFRLCLWSSYLLVTVFHGHLSLAAPPTPRSPSSEEPSSSSPTSASVVWSSPAPGDRFGPGDTITGEWQTTQDVVSPSFKLCAGGEDGCGATVWPEVVESAGYYHVSLTAPNVTTESGYYLQMKDDFGDKYTSPIFNLTPTPQKEDTPDVAQPRPRPDQVPMSTPSSSPSHGSKSNGAAHSDPVAPAQADPGGGVPGASPNSTTSLTPGVGGGGGGGPLVAAAHNAPPTAALAVPLSLTGAIVLIAGGLLLHHRRQLAAERVRCNAQLAANATITTTPSSSGSTPNPHPVGLASHLGDGRIGTTTSGTDKGGDRYNHHGDAEKAALFVRALCRGDSSERHHAYGAYHDRRPDAPYAQGAPEPRLRTRQLDLVTREFSTHTRRRPHPSSSSSSSSPSSSPSHPSSYRGIFGNRHSVRRSGSTNTYNGGASSLWRSLSIARRKLVTPSTSLASPALTESAGSVTSEVLPSYFPSPNFDGAAPQREFEHCARTSDLGFVNIPLSPPLPPPLHTRGEAVEPDDSRMRELRGVYEAVAHALGGVRRV